jgi:hydroxypyruvate isomerase
MPRFAANLSMLFTEIPFLDRFAAAREAGFTAVEILFPYDVPVGVLAAHVSDNGLKLVLFNAAPGDWHFGERGIAAMAGREDEFARQIDQALVYATALGCPTIHVMAGILPDGADLQLAYETYVANLARATTAAAAAGVTLAIEPINSRDMPGYFLSTTREARRAIAAVGAPNLGLQLDLYHRQIMEGDLATAIRSNLQVLRHVQIAGPPDRREPDDGEVNFPYLFDLLDQVGYGGYVGCEYRPRGRTMDGLGWFAPWRA